jgi:hypothetical protein
MEVRSGESRGHIIGHTVSKAQVEYTNLQLRRGDVTVSCYTTTRSRISTTQHSTERRGRVVSILLSIRDIQSSDVVPETGYLA